MCGVELVPCLACLKAVRMHLGREHTKKGPEDPVGIEAFRGSTGREKQKGPGNDSPANRGKGLKQKKMIITNAVNFFSLPVTFTLYTINK